MQLYPTPDNPLPEGAQCVTVTTRDALSLRACYVPHENPRGTILLMGGRADYMERYFETMRDFQSRGYCVVSFDFRGQGGSQRLHANPLRGHIRDFRQYDDDVAAVMEEIVLPRCPKPHFAVAHSTGGHVLLRVLRTETWFEKAVALAPLLGIQYGKWPQPVVRTLLMGAHLLNLGWLFLPGHNKKPLGPEHFPNPLTTDKRRWMRDITTLQEAPQLGLGGPTFSWLRAARRSLAELGSLGRRNRLTCPTLIIGSGLDRIVDTEATRIFAERVPGVSLVIIDEALHEIPTERDEIRNQFLAIIDSFFGSPEGSEQAKEEPLPEEAAALQR